MTLADSQKIHILLIEEELGRKHSLEHVAEQSFYLTKQAENFHTTNRDHLYKYQSADQILDGIFEQYCEQTKGGLFRETKRFAPKLIGIYSPIHRAGKTTFALELGKELARQGKSLYINFEEYAGFGSRFQQDTGKNLSDALYYMKQEEMGIQMSLHGVVSHMEELDYIAPMICNQDLKEITKDEWVEFLEQISKHSIYENLILDFSESVRGLPELLKLCDVIYMPILEDKISKEKLSQYENNLKQLQMSDLNEKTKRILVPERVTPFVKALVREEWEHVESRGLI